MWSTYKHVFINVESIPNSYQLKDNVPILALIHKYEDSSLSLHR